MEKDYQLFTGRPQNAECIPMEEKVYDYLDNLGIDYKTLKHPAAFTIEECNKVRDKVNAPVFKNLFLTNKQQTNFYLLVMPGEKVFKTKYLSAQINSAPFLCQRRFHGAIPGSDAGLCYSPGAYQ